MKRNLYQTNHLVQDHNRSKISRIDFYSYRKRFVADTTFLLIVFPRLAQPRWTEKRQSWADWHFEEDLTVKSFSVNRIRSWLAPRCNRSTSWRLIEEKSSIKNCSEMRWQLLLNCFPEILNMFRNDSIHSTIRWLTLR